MRAGWVRVAPFLYERPGRVRVHLGGHIAVPDGPRWRVIWLADALAEQG